MSLGTALSWTKYAAVVLCALALGACTGQPGETDEFDQDLGAISGSKALTGVLDASGTSWVRAGFSASAGAKIDLSLDWANASADLNLFLYDASGTLVKYSNGASKPETVSFLATRGGAFAFGIKCATAKTAYTATVRVTPPPSKRTLFGESLSGPNGMKSALDRFGKIPVARVYMSEGQALPASWASAGSLSGLPAGTDVVLSFKPSGYGSSPTNGLVNIANGAADADIKSLMRSRPAGVRVWLSLYHEPEDNLASGAFTVAQFKNAWTHFGGVVRSLGDPGVSSVLILMRYTLNAGSGRDWHDFYVDNGPDMLAWDAYNSAHDANPPGYLDAAKIIDPIRAVADETGKPWGIGEFGSPIISGDDGRGRAAWLQQVADLTLADGRAEFFTYWDRAALSGTTDYSLSDPASIRVWRALSNR